MMSFMRITCIEEMTPNQSYMLMSQSYNHMYPSVQSYFSSVVTCPGHPGHPGHLGQGMSQSNMGIMGIMGFKGICTYLPFHSLIAIIIFN